MKAATTPAERLLELYRGREGVYAEGYLKDGLVQYRPVREPLTLGAVEAHLRGERTLGVYLLRADSTVHFGAIDLDASEEVRAKSNGHLPTEPVVRRLRSVAVELGVPASAMLAAFSGRKGHHLEIFFADPVPGAEARRLLELILSRVQLTAAISAELFPKQEHLSNPNDPHNLGSLVKLPLGLHPLTRAKAEFLEPQTVIPMTATALAEILAKHGPVEVDGEYRRAEPIPEGLITEGRRHDTLASLAGSLRQRGLDEATILEALRSVNRTRCQPPKPDAEVVAIAGWIGDRPAGDRGGEIRQGSEDNEDSNSITVRRLADLRKLPDAEVEWLVERFAASGSISDLVAFIKTGKTTLAAQLVASVLHGESFLGRFKVQKSPVVLLTEERPASLLAALDDAGVADEDELHVLLWTEQSGIAWAEIVAQAAALCSLVGARLLVVDTLGMWAGVDDENAAAEARTAMTPLMQIASGLAILVLRQSRKESGGIHNAGRGSGAYGGAADILLHLDYTRDEKGKVLEESPQRWLSVKSRLERDQVPAMKLDYADGRYQALDFTIVDGRTRRVIMADLGIHGASRPADVAKRTGIRRNTVSVTLGRMDGLVAETDGNYSLTGAGRALAGAGDKGGDNR